jgi:hypothetical protein
MIADFAELRTAVRADRRGDYGEISLWTGIAILAVVMLVLFATSANFDLRPALTAEMCFGP